ncbi:MAG: hypothetical protein WD024_05295 [Bacillota bacterium]
MQLNIYVPKEKERVLIQLDALSRDLGRPKNEIVLMALEQYLGSTPRRAELGTYPTKTVGQLSRKDIYGDRWRS